MNSWRICNNLLQSLSMSFCYNSAVLEKLLLGEDSPFKNFFIFAKSVNIIFFTKIDELTILELDLGCI